MRRLTIISIFLLLASFLAEAQLNINHYIRVGRTRISIGNYTGAIEYFNIVIKFKPYLPEVYFYRGVAKHQLEDFRGAIIDYDEAIRIKPYYPQAYMNRGMAWHNLGEYEKAIEDYNRGLEFDPDDESIYNNRGIARLALKDVAGAIADYNRALEINPKSTNSLMNRSNAHIVEGDVEAAIRDLNQVIIIRPHFSAAYLNRGLARFEMDDYASALRDYDQAIRLDSENSMAFNNRGIVKHKLGDYAGAVMDYDMALKLNPEMASAYFNRAMAREVLGRSGFEDDYRIAAQLNPQFDLSKRHLDADQLAQNQSQQGSASSGSGSGSSVQNSSPANNNDSKSDDEDDKEDEEKKETEASEERQSRRRERINLVVEDSRDLPSDDEEVDDGRIQNRNVVIDPQPIFVISAFEKGAVDYERTQYYNLAIDELNQLNNYNPIYTISNRPATDYHDLYENFVLYYNERIEISQSSHNFLNRGIFHSLTGAYNDAITDFNRSVELDQSRAMAYFSRANARFKMVEQIEILSQSHQEVVVPVTSMVSSSEGTDQLDSHEYDEILEDYQMLLYLNPDFFFGYYNRAFIKLRLKEYKSAMEDLNRAIDQEPEFAEAYFNRGLIKIYLDDVEGGALDLSRAGELGIHGAYNIIKRYCN